MTTHDRIKAYITDINRLAKAHGVRNLRLFGSAVRGEDRPDSDIDILVEMDLDRSLLDRIAFMQALEDLLGRKIDVVNERALHESIREQVLRESVPL